MNEAWAALFLAIVGDYSVEEAIAKAEGRKRRGTHKWTLEEIQKVDDLRNDGVTWQSIGDKFGMSCKTVNQAWRRFKERGLI